LPINQLAVSQVADWTTRRLQFFDVTKRLHYICTQRKPNSPAELVAELYDGGSRHHVTPLLVDHLHWLRARERISFKLCILVYEALHGFAPCYSNKMCTPIFTLPKLSALRSTARGDLVVIRTRLQLGNRAFCVAGPVAWNSLPLDIGHSLRTNIINFQKHAQDTSFLTFLLH